MRMTTTIIDEMLAHDHIYIKGPLSDSIVPITKGYMDNGDLGYRVGSSHYKKQPACDLINDGVWQIGTKEELNPTKMYKIW